MKLCYRGIDYENKAAILEVVKGEVGGKYRGQDWYDSYPRHIPHLKPKIYRQYRGIAYSTCPIAKNDTSYNFYQNNDTDFNKQLLDNRRNQIVQHSTKTTDDIHIDNIRRNLERRIAVAKAKGDDYLISLLEKEFNQLVAS